MTALLALAPFTDFAAAFDVDRYRAVPDAWFVAVSDVIDSTAAIKSGRYKEVNMAGAATIVAVLNACRRDDLPFSFGGDGGVVLIPPELERETWRALSAVQRLCREALGLRLRCSLIPVEEVRNRSREVLVASHDLGSGKMLAMLAGGGIAAAEKLCKSPEGAPFAVAEGNSECDLTGLSCRWEPLRAQHGLIMALVVQARDTTSQLPAIYRDIYARMQSVTGPEHSPVKMGSLSARWPPSGTALEAALTGRKNEAKRRRKILLQQAVALLSLATGKTLRGFHGRTYRDSLPRHTDYRKYADSLRMVIDCTHAQADTIVELLQAEHSHGRIDFGTHRAGAALMTCFVRNTQEAGHVHFIDGAEGGYALAALDMKRRIREAQG